MKRLHYCYLLTRTLPEGGCRYYVGIRTAPKGKTPATDTSYMGSGRRIKLAVKAHRAEFTKTIVDVFDTRAEAKAMERALVGLATANSPWSYNLVTGGEDSGLASEETKAKLREAVRARSEESERRRLERSTQANRHPEARKANSARQRQRYEDRAEREKTGAGSKRVWDGYTSDERAARVEKAAEVCRELAQTEEWQEANAKGARRRFEDPAKLEAHTERMRELAQDPAWQAATTAAARRPEVREKKTDGIRRYFDSETPEARDARIENQTAGARRRCQTSAGREQLRAASRSAWAKFETAEARSAEQKRRAAVARENKRIKREVQMILAALIVNKYGGAEAA